MAQQRRGLGKGLGALIPDAQRTNQGAVGRPRRRSQLRTRPLGESEKRWLIGEVRRVVQSGSCDVAARGAPQSHMKYTRRRAIRLQGRAVPSHASADECVAPTALR